MKTAPFNILLLALLLTTCVSCKKKNQEKELPPATQNGANTIGFKVNGEVWVPDEPYWGVNVWVEYIYNKLSIAATNNEKGYSTGINIRMKYIDELGEYTCIDSNIYSLSYVNDNLYCFGCLIQNDWVEITKLDTHAKIISGTFEFLAECDSNTTFHITEGRFDFQYPQP